MFENKLKILLAVIMMVGAILSCTIRQAETPTPFAYPTPDLTKTALFGPTATTGQGESGTPVESATPEEASSTETPLPTDTHSPTETWTPTWTPSPTYPPTWTYTPTATESYIGPNKRPGVSIQAKYFTVPPTIDGDLWDWSLTVNAVNEVVYGKDKHTGAADCSGSVMVGWDDDYLYLGGWVKDDVYVQRETGEKIFKGDSLEILLDSKVSFDFYLDVLSLDDYQIGISPGLTTIGSSPEAYLWYPSSRSKTLTNVIISALATADGYQFEVAIPWSIFKIDPSGADHYGFGISISDNDHPTRNSQQSMVSNLPGRVLTRPMTWGDLKLVK